MKWKKSPLRSQKIFYLEKDLLPNGQVDRHYSAICVIDNDTHPNLLMEKYKKIPVWNRFSLNLSDISFIITFSHPCGTLIILLFYIMRPSILIFPGFPGKVLCFEIPMAVLTPWEAMILLEKWTQTNSSQQAANCYSQIESSGKGLSRLWSNLMGKLYNYLLLELRRRETKIWTQL